MAQNARQVELLCRKAHIDALVIGHLHSAEEKLAIARACRRIYNSVRIVEICEEKPCLPNVEHLTRTSNPDDLVRFLEGVPLYPSQNHS